MGNRSQALLDTGQTDGSNQLNGHINSTNSTILIKENTQAMGKASGNSSYQQMRTQDTATAVPHPSPNSREDSAIAGGTALETIFGKESDKEDHCNAPVASDNDSTRFDDYAEEREPVLPSNGKKAFKSISKRLKLPFRRSSRKSSSLRRRLSQTANEEAISQDASPAASAPATPVMGVPSLAEDVDIDMVPRRRKSFTEGFGRLIRRASIQRASARNDEDIDTCKEYPVVADARLFSGLFAGAHSQAPIAPRDDAIIFATQSDAAVNCLKVMPESTESLNSALNTGQNATSSSKLTVKESPISRTALQKQLNATSETRISPPEEQTLASSEAVLCHTEQSGRKQFFQGTVKITTLDITFSADSKVPQLCFNVPWDLVVAIRPEDAAGIAFVTVQRMVRLVEIRQAAAVLVAAQCAHHAASDAAADARRVAYMTRVRRRYARLGPMTIPMDAKKLSRQAGNYAERVADVVLGRVPPAAAIKRLIGDGRVPLLYRGAVFRALSEGAAVIGDTGWRMKLPADRTAQMAASENSTRAGPEARHPQRSVWVNVPASEGRTLRLELRLRQTLYAPDACVVDAVLRIRPGVAAGILDQPTRTAVAVRWSVFRLPLDRSAHGTMLADTRLVASVAPIDLDGGFAQNMNEQSHLLLGIVRRAIRASAPSNVLHSTDDRDSPEFQNLDTLSSVATLVSEAKCLLIEALAYKLRPTIALAEQPTRSTWRLAFMVFVIAATWLITCSALFKYWGPQTFSDAGISGFDEALATAQSTDHSQALLVLRQRLSDLINARDADFNS